MLQNFATLEHATSFHFSNGTRKPAVHLSPLLLARSRGQIGHSGVHDKNSMQPYDL
jgi:hypothetical protein